VTTDKLIGSVGTRVAAMVFSLLCVMGFILSRYRFFGETRSSALTLAVISGILAGVAAIYSFRASFSLWMRFTKVLHVFVTMLLFGACYIVVVPFFFLVIRVFDPLCLRKQPEPRTFWIQRRNVRVEGASLQRMG
jgi:hypothetical protein